MTLLRILIGFAVACLGAGLTMVLFVLTPSEIAGLPPDVAGDRLSKAFDLALVVAGQVALFSAPLALIMAVWGELWGKREWTFYVIFWLAIAGLGFFAQHQTEQVGQPTIVNNYALTAFLTAGFVSGMLYWILSGRVAGSARAEVPVAKPVTTSADTSADSPAPSQG